MKRLIYSILFIVILLFAFDRIGGKILWELNKYTKNRILVKINRIENGLSESVVIFGTSRANNHYVSSILSDSLELSVYNAGLTGSRDIYSQYISLLPCVAYKSVPKIVCLELSPTDYIVKDDDPYSAIRRYALYIGMSEQTDAVFKEAGYYPYYQISHLYRYNNTAIQLLNGLIYSRNEKAEDNGYIPLPPPPHFPDTLKNSDFVFSCDSNKVKYIRKFISLCREHNILLVFTVSPVYLIASPNEYGVLKQIADENGIPFFDYHSAGLYLDHPEYFKDNVHLWDKGARLFTSVFAHDLKMYLDSVGFFKQEVE